MITSEFRSRVYVDVKEGTYQIQISNKKGDIVWLEDHDVYSLTDLTARASGRNAQFVQIGLKIERIPEELYRYVLDRFNGKN